MAILIVTLHAHPFTGISKVVDYALSYGLTRVAVPFFFIASGFFMFRKMTESNTDWHTIKKYVKRIFRIYCVWTLIYMPIIIWTSFLNDNQGIAQELIILVRNFFMTASYSQLWFLPALIVAILCVGYLLSRKWTINSILILSGILYIIGLFGQSYYGLFVFFFPEGSLGHECVKFASKIFVTTRNGLCFGFVYVAIGAYISFSKIEINIKK